MKILFPLMITFTLLSCGQVIEQDVNSDPPPGSPFAPSDLSAYAPSSDAISLSWTDNSDDENGFQVERSLSSGMNFSQIATISLDTGNYLDNTGLNPGTTYYYRMRAYNAMGSSSYSNEANAHTPGGSTGGQIIADHSVVSSYVLIPQVYIDEIKKMFLNIPGESHSMGYRLGVSLLMQQDSKYAVSVDVSGSTPPEEYTDEYLRVSRATWGRRGSSSGWAYSYGEEDFYVDGIALSATENHITYCALNNREIDVLGFGWCWDMTWHNSPGGEIDPVFDVHWAGSSVGGPDGDLRWGLDDGDIPLTDNHVTMNTYLDAVEDYNTYSQTNGYRTKVIFTTGPAEGGGESGYQRHLKHEHIRSFVLADSSRILFDYADILNYNESGSKNTTSWNAQTFGIIHPDNMLDMDGSYSEDGDHIGERGALRLGKAIWWMLARMNGWDGVSSD